MKNKKQMVWILAVNLSGIALSLFLTFWIFMENVKTLVYNETPYVIFLFPFTAGLIALVLTVPLRLLRVVKKYIHVTIMVILAMPAALLLFANDDVESALAEKNHLQYLQDHWSLDAISKVETRLKSREYTDRFEAAIPEGFYVDDADHPVNDSRRFWLALLKPSFWRGADEYFASYDADLNRFSELKTGKQLWDEWYAKHGEPKPFEVEGAGRSLHEGIVTYYKKGIGTYKCTLGSDPENKTIFIEKITLDPAWK
jgi:hypothetical protein